MPVIFLDFDGVLNSLRTALAFGGFDGHQLDPAAVGLVARLAKESCAQVVISSSWRVGRTLDDLREILRSYSAALADRVIGMTPRINGPRGAEIAKWLAENDGAGRGYVIIDDDSDMLDGQLPHFVQTSMRDGFGIVEYHRALTIIAPDHEDVPGLARYVGRDVAGDVE